jgi:hypothetical protein
MIDLKSIASEIREIISERQKSLGLLFEEDKHVYTMNGKKDYPSVSKVLKSFYREFPLEEAALKKAGGNPQEAERLKEEWAAAGTYSTNLGSRVHYILEKTLIENNGNYKEVRQPIFDCDLTQLMKSDNMIFAGKRYLELMESRNVELLDTEMVLGDPELGFVGQPDKVWLTMNKTEDEFGLLITDWKTNKKIDTKSYDKYELPLEHLRSSKIVDYSLQISIYRYLCLFRSQ